MNKRFVKLALANILPALLILFVAITKFVRFWEIHGYWRLSHVLLEIQLIAAVVLFLARTAPHSVSWKPWDVVMALLGSFAPSLFSFKDEGDPHPFGIALQVVGNLLSFYAMISLGRSFGVIPANRGIQTKGMYAWLRHPIYASYQIANLGYFVNHPDAYNLAVYLLCILSQVVRIFGEERLLEQDPAYQEYRERVRWRLIPFVF